MVLHSADSLSAVFDCLFLLQHHDSAALFADHGVVSLAEDGQDGRDCFFVHTATSNYADAFDLIGGQLDIVHNNTLWVRFIIQS